LCEVIFIKRLIFIILFLNILLFSCGIKNNTDFGGIIDTIEETTDYVNYTDEITLDIHSIILSEIERMKSNTEESLYFSVDEMQEIFKNNRQLFEDIKDMINEYTANNCRFRVSFITSENRFDNMSSILENKEHIEVKEEDYDKIKKLYDIIIAQRGDTEILNCMTVIDGKYNVECILIAIQNYNGYDQYIIYNPNETAAELAPESAILLNTEIEKDWYYEVVDLGWTKEELLNRLIESASDDNR